MSLRLRLIARLDVKNDTVVKGIHLEGLRVVGKPFDLAKKYADQGADEILYMDAVASLYDRNNLVDIVSRTSADIFIPVTVGGGIRTLDDIETLLHSGADKVAMNTAAIRRPEFISEAANRFGSQCIVLSVEAKRIACGKWEAYVDTGREPTGKDVVIWAKQAVDLGVGEVLVTSIDHEGTKNGTEIELVKSIVDAVPVPVIASGGVGTVQHVVDVVRNCRVNAVASASLFHYDICSFPELKSALSTQGIRTRT